MAKDNSKQLLFKSKLTINKRASLPKIQSGDKIDYKNIRLLIRFISQQGKIIPRRVSKVTFKQQRLITIAIKKARILALLPFKNNENLFKLKRAQIAYEKKYLQDLKKKRKEKKDRKIREQNKSKEQKKVQSKVQNKSKEQKKVQSKVQ